MTADAVTAGGMAADTVRAPSTCKPAARAAAVRLMPYRAAHLDALILQPAQAHVQALLAGRGYAQSLEACEAYSVLAGERVIACLGVYPMHARRALAWGLIARDCGPHLLTLHKAAHRWLGSTPYTRIEAHVDRGFAAGARWLRLLGFECETPQGMRGFTLEGGSCDLYAWVREAGQGATSLPPFPPVRPEPVEGRTRN